MQCLPFNFFDAAAQQFDKGLTQYDGVHTTYMDIVQGVVSCKPIIVIHTLSLYIALSLTILVEQIQSTIDEVLLDHIAHLDLIQNSIDSANETWNGVLSMLKSINSTVIVTEINQNTSNSIEILNQTMNNCKYTFSLPQTLLVSLCVVSQSVR